MNHKDLLCPFCGSLSRNRRLWSLLHLNNDLKGNVLHFSPSRNLYRKLKKNKRINYFSSDFENEFFADYKYNITNINQKDKTFDTIICYHILEHIENDQKAMSELHRVLKPNGKIYIQTPFKTGKIYENRAIILPEDRLKHFGQDDHVRIYSENGLKQRLEKNNFSVSKNTFKENDENTFFGFMIPETVLIAKRAEL